ncbi:hypothetical protein [Cellulomonas marina]|uniref:hypothetical protein n=1 Tax=Cellulomonas marina TaxID=988821 RepID=UPI000B7E86B9|nr:hypothetical protein [Cellulomonas marina]GIG30796.1 hypothetical protein Cma02nite_33960 [Cellulomonas marina]
MTTTRARDAAAVLLRERWRQASLGTVWRRVADWSGPEVEELAAAVSSGACPVGAAEDLGRARGYDGVGIGEALDDLTCLFVAAGQVATPPAVVRAFCVAWSDAQADALAVGASTDPETGLPRQEYLAVRLEETYLTAARRGRSVTEEHCLVLVDVAAGDLPPLARAARSAVAGDALARVYGHGHPMATLGGGLFAVLDDRDGVEDRVHRTHHAVSALCAGLEAAVGVRVPPHVWSVPLPATHDEAVRLLGRHARQP